MGRFLLFWVNYMLYVSYDSNMDRRQFSASVGSICVATLSGCTGLLPSGSKGPEDFDGPEATTRAYWQAVGDSDIETQQQLVHDDSSIDTIDDFSEVNINKIESKSISEIWNEVPNDSVRYDSKEELEEHYASIAEDSGSDNYIIVDHNVELDGNEQAGATMLVSENGNWLVWHIFL